jgi:hypothetical protein
VAFNVLAFPHIPSNNLGAQVHHHATPKAFCQFNITRVTHQLGLVHRSNNCPSGLIFFLFLAQVGPFYVLALIGPGPLSAFLKFGSLSALACYWPFLDFSPSVTSFKVWLIVSPYSLSAPFGVLARC